jgi:hypothetical protein
MIFIIHILLSLIISSLERMQRVIKEDLVSVNKEGRVYQYLCLFSSLISTPSEWEMAGWDKRRFEGHPWYSQFALGFNLCVFKMWIASRW